MEKITNVIALERTIATLTEQNFDAEVIEKLTNIKNSYAKKSKAEKKPTSTQLANEGLKTEIVELLNAEPNRLFSVTEIAKALGDYSTQKVSPLCKALFEGNLIIKVEEKRKTFYKSNLG